MALARIGTVGVLLMIQMTAQGTGEAGLRTLAERHGLLIGTAVNTHALARDADYRDAMAREFSVVTAENAMKFGPLRPSREAFAFERADTIVAFAQEHGMKVRGHTLVWHNQLPKWFEAGAFSRSEMLDVLHEHIQTVVSHYRGKVYAWDVINEGLAPDGGLRDTIFLRTIGPEYVERAKPGGVGTGAYDHKCLYDYRSLSELFESCGFRVECLEYYDEQGEFHCLEWDPEDGMIHRSKRFDRRNTGGKLAYTSLILDAWK